MNINTKTVKSKRTAVAVAEVNVQDIADDDIDWEIFDDPHEMGR